MQGYFSALEKVFRENGFRLQVFMVNEAASRARDLKQASARRPNGPPCRQDPLVNSAASAQPDCFLRQRDFEVGNQERRGHSPTQQVPARHVCPIHRGSGRDPSALGSAGAKPSCETASREVSYREAEQNLTTICALLNTGMEDRRVRRPIRLDDGLTLAP